MLHSRSLYPPFSQPSDRVADTAPPAPRLVHHIGRSAGAHQDQASYAWTLHTPTPGIAHGINARGCVSDFAKGDATLLLLPLFGETAAETGHLVLSTLHCASASMAIDRIVDVFPEHQQSQVRLQLAGALRAVVTQLLLPSTRPPARVPVFEKLVVNTAVATKIREGRVHQLQSEIQKGRNEGMVPLELPLARMVRSGRLSMDTALSVSGDPQSLGELVRGNA